jgi:uncharacterized damage-inducible protein DinB
MEPAKTQSPAPFRPGLRIGGPTVIASPARHAGGVATPSAARYVQTSIQDPIANSLEGRMPIADAVLPEFDQEMASTRKLLERLPDEHKDWKPHEKSWPLGSLAIHLCNLPVWAVMTLQQTELDVNPPGGAPWKSPAYTDRAAALAMFDDNVKAARAAIAATSDKDYMVDWSLKNAGHTLMTLPRVVCLRSFVLNHMIHHRGQLTVYLRLKNVPLPSIYGPTADDAAGMA